MGVAKPLALESLHRIVATVRLAPVAAMALLLKGDDYLHREAAAAYARDVNSVDDGRRYLHRDVAAAYARDVNSEYGLLEVHFCDGALAVVRRGWVVEASARFSVVGGCFGGFDFWEGSACHMQFTNR